MAKKLKDYQDEAQGLGIDITDKTINELRSEIKSKKAEIKSAEDLTKAQSEAETLGIDVKGLDIEALNAAIESKKSEIKEKEDLIKAQEEAEKLGINTEGLGINEILSAIGSKKSELDNSKTQELERKEEPSPNVKKQIEAKRLRDQNRKLQKKKEQELEAKADDSKSLAEKAKKDKKDNRKVFTDDRGLKFRFKKTAPKSLNIDGRSIPVKEIIEDKEIMLELVYGNSNFIEQIYS